MKRTIALLTGVLLLFPALARAQTASPSPAASPSAAPLDTPTITIPDGWTPKEFNMSAGGFTMIRMWYKPQGGGDNINLGYSPNPTGAGLTDIVAQARQVLTKMLGAGNVSDHAEKLCNGTADGWLFHGKLAMGAMHMTVDEVLLPSKHDAFGATYTRMSAHPDDPAALKALDTLCVKS